MIRRCILGLIFLVLLSGCSGDSKPELVLALPSDTSKDTIERIQAAIPAMEEHLPGLFKYQSSMAFLEVRPSFSYFSVPGSGLPEETKVTWLAFKVKDDDKAIPRDYHANGHRIEIGIEDTGKALILQKRQSKAVFLDRIVPPSGGDKIIPIF